MTAVDIDTTAQDAAWWAMEVPCSADECDAAATWLWCMPCGCREPACTPHKVRHTAYMASLGVDYRGSCTKCGARGLSPADHYWRPL